MNIEKKANKVLKHLWREYRRTGETVQRFDNLGEAAEFCHVESQHIYGAVQFLKGKNLITHEPMVIRAAGVSSGEAHIIELTNEGIRYAEEKFERWLNKVWNSFRADPEHWIPPIIAAIPGIVALILTLT